MHGQSEINSAGSKPILRKRSILVLSVTHEALEVDELPNISCDLRHGGRLNFFPFPLAVDLTLNFLRTLGRNAPNLNAMPEVHFLITQMHELFSYLNQKGILTIMIVLQTGLFGDRVETRINVSYLADSVVMLRYFEYRGMVKKAISVVKKRSGERQLPAPRDRSIISAR